ncbi:FAD-dependent oxidoreductase [Nitrospira lenta]|uniref:Putative Pytoene desaturase n=1 Tax=Nitrospira lenta TaxID=1436998 RepID=A0A330LAN4_9BACT|nr:FAD-dependent oxidoreductase [Nitrospira lenta]SPP66808.1 putative Pytoene desaturase [Nitrospira lenta]
MTTPPAESVVILGTSLASLVAAYELARQGYHLTLIEHPSWADDLPASEHLLGCHRNMHALLGTLPGLEPAPKNPATPLEFFSPDRRIVSYRPPALPGSLQWIAGLVRFRGLSWTDRWQLLSYLERIWEQELSAPTTLDQRTADVWLASIGQSQSARKHIWSPLIRFLTGNALTDLSAASCARALTPPFLTDARASSCTRLSSAQLQNLYHQLKMALSALGAHVQIQTDFPHIQFGQHRIDHIRLSDGRTLHATWYLSGIPHHALQKLLPDRLLTRYGYFSQLSDLTDLPALSVHLTESASTSIPRLVLLPGQGFQSVTVSRTDPSTALYELSVTGDIPFIERTDADLIDLAKQELQRLFPALQTIPLHATALHRRPRAALSLTSGATILRPIQQSPVQNLLVAGAWTDTGWPTSSESAVVSARRCVTAITGSPS